jgi:cytochrome c oxidase subunit 2
MLPQASTIAADVDAIFIFLCILSAILSLGIFATVGWFALRYHRRHWPVATQIEGNTRLEILWTIIPLCILMAVFLWGALVYFRATRPPEGAMEIFVTGKQWMWKVQHPSGKREINALHVPVGLPVKLTMTSEDVIHAFFVPAFRVKKDVLPGRYTSLWFEATKEGSYHLFCAEYCGTEHSRMTGQVIAMAAQEFERWQSGDIGETLAQAGARMFQSLGCHTCHSETSGARGPNLAGMFGNAVQLQDGSQAVADETYLRESLLSPLAKVVAGYAPVMPTYAAQVNEEGVLRLTAYIRGLK